VEVQQSCGYIDVLLVTWLAKREGDSRCWPCASWSVTDISVSESELESIEYLLRFLASYTESINLLKYLEMLKSIVTYSA